MQNMVSSSLLVSTASLDTKKLQDELKKQAENLPFFRAVKLFEEHLFEEPKYLDSCYDLFMECALSGNTYALFYIKYLHENFSFEINKKANLIVNHLEYWLQNAPSLNNVKPQYWLEVSLIKQKLKQKIDETEQKELLNKLWLLAPYCTAGYILLQDIICNHKYTNIALTAKQYEKYIKKFKCIFPEVIDLFMMAYIEKDLNYHNEILIGKYFITDLHNIIKLIEENGIDKYRLHGELERLITETECYRNPTTFFQESYNGINKQRYLENRKISWQRSSAFMGNAKGYMMFVVSCNSDPQIILFAALAGHLYCKAKILQFLSTSDMSLTNPFLKIQNLKLVEEWLLSFNDITTEHAILSVEKEGIILEDFKEALSLVYVNCGGVLYNNATQITENKLIKQQYIDQAIACYFKAAKLGNSLGFFNLGKIYQSNINNSLDEQSNIKLAIGMYDKAYKLGYQEAVSQLISLNYYIENYEAVHKYIEDLIAKKVNIVSFANNIPIIYAKMFKYGFGVYVINKDLSYKIFIDSAKLGNYYSQLEVIKDFIGANEFASRLLTSKELLNIGLNLYNNCPKVFGGNEFQLNLKYNLVVFFAHKDFLNQGGRDIVLELIKEGLSDNNLSIKTVFAEYSLFGNEDLNIPENGLITITYLNELLATRNSIAEKNKPAIYIQLGIAYMRGVGLDINYELAEQYLQQAYQLKAEHVEYNLWRLYFNMGKFEEAFNYLSEGLKSDPENSAILCNMAQHYLSGLGVEKNFDLGKTYLYKAFELNNQEVIPDYVIINVLDMFLNQKVKLNLLQEYEKILSQYIGSLKFYSNDEIYKKFLWLLEASLILLNEPFQYPNIIRKLKLIEAPDVSIKFAIKYLENKPYNRDINYLGIDLFCIVVLLRISSTETDLEKFFDSQGLSLNFQQTKKVTSLSQQLVTNSNNYDDNKIDKFQKKSSKFINKISLEELKGLCFIASKWFPEKVSCIIKHAKSGSGEKIELSATESHAKSLFLFHPEHRSNRSRQEKSDPKRNKSILRFSEVLFSRIISSDNEEGFGARMKKRSIPL